jgi:DNA-binding beta-propeller fold protein YncE
MNDPRPRLDMRATCKVGGVPGEILPSADGSLLFVADRESRRVSVLAANHLTLFQSIDLGIDSPPARPFLLASFEDDAFASFHGGKVAVLSASTRQLHGVIDVRGEARGMAVLPESRQALVAVASIDEGFLAHLELSPHRLVMRRPLPGLPVDGTLTVDTARERAAVAVHPEPGRTEIVICPLRSGASSDRIPIDGAVAALALDGSGEFLYAACPDASEVVIVDLAGLRILERLPLPGRPFQLELEAGSSRVWALCEELGHAALLDPQRHGVVRHIFTPGIRREDNRFAFRPDGRFFAIPERQGQCVSLACSGAACKEVAQEVERLELGRGVGRVAWSPLGDELYVSDAERGEVVALKLDLPIGRKQDTDYLLRDLNRRREAGRPPKDPLFPP